MVFVGIKTKSALIKYGYPDFQVINTKYTWISNIKIVFDN